MLPPSSDRLKPTLLPCDPLQANGVKFCENAQKMPNSILCCFVASLVVTFWNFGSVMKASMKSSSSTLSAPSAKKQKQQQSMCHAL